MSLKLLNQIVNAASRRVSLRTALIAPFVLQIFAVAGLLGYLSFKNGQRAVNDVATQLRSELTDRIKQNLDTYLDTPQRLNQSNANAIRLGELDVRNFAALEAHFWHQLALFDRVTVIGYANQDRELIAAERQSNQALTMRVSGKATGYDLRTYTTNQQGQRLAIINVGKHYNPHKRSWYKTPLQTGKQSWSEIYPHVTGETLYLGASQPVYNPDGSVEGVLLSNLNLLQLGAFLRSLKIGKHGQGFIIERSGLFVATSTAEAPFQITTKPVALPEEKVIRLKVTASRDPLTQATANYLTATFGDFHAIKTPQQLDFTIKQQRQFLQVVPFKDDRGIDWLIVVVIPEADFMEQIDLNTRTTVLLCFAALAVSVIMGILTARWITQPIVSVSQSAKALADGEWEQTVDIERSGVLGEMARSFNQMAQQIRTSFTAMQSLNKALSDNESKLKQFLEAVPVGIAILDASGRPYYTNERATQLLGQGAIASVSAEQIPAFYEIYVAGTQQIYPAEALAVVRALKGERTTADNLEVHRGDKIIPIETWGTPVFDQDGNIVYAIVAFQDITDRKQAEKLLADYNEILAQQVAERTLELEREQLALQQSETTNRAMISAIPDLLIQMSQDGTYLKVVRSGNFPLFNPHQLKVGMNIHDVLPPSVAQQRMEYAQQAIETGELQVYEQQIVSDNQVYDQEVRIAASGEGEVLVMVRDISDRRQAEEASILEERNRMAREIHDTLAQAFTSIIVHLDAATQRLTLDPEAAQSHLKTGRILARSGLSDARRSVEALRPQLLEEGDLQSALDRYATQMFSHTSVQVSCEAIGEPYTLPSEIETNLLRIGQEALTNAFKYANASEICVELRYERSHCLLQIKDNGRGFESSLLSIGQGFGLLGMTERAERIGAELTIQSHPGQGTEIIVRVQTS
ncbi:PAS domain-containing protein [Stenomitos frigidus]|uniref:histidine kinase n=1 Tax=Stenomitos frigidus ULC18 TaxID=2107698 RepID=A0A2T1DUA4_9CYAN|nr:PAS domain-containing protein [Stenomitos frigidus]PSB24079.1 hypothetical protein C7B82_28465 [Stenomitos frigidus ULC18]